MHDSFILNAIGFCVLGFWILRILWWLYIRISFNKSEKELKSMVGNPNFSREDYMVYGRNQMGVADEKDKKQMKTIKEKMKKEKEEKSVFGSIWDVFGSIWDER